MSPSSALPPTSRPHASLIAVALLWLLLPFCGTDDSGSPFRLPDGIDSPPAIPAPRIPAQPRIPFEIDAAREARSIVNAQINMIPYATRACGTAIASINSGKWDQAGSACWTKERGAPPGQGCSSVVSACFRGAQFEYSEVLDGLCQDGIYEDRQYDHWRHLHSVAGIDASAGTFTEYEKASETPKRSWTWNLGSEPPSGEWSFFAGAIDEANLFARLDWAAEADGTVQLAWLWDETGKWEMEVSADGGTGAIVVHQWSGEPSGWIHRYEIDWADAHGRMKTFDDNGALLSETDW